MKTSQIKIRKARATDSQNIRALEDKVWGEEVVNKYDIPMFVRFGYVFVAEYKQKLIGAIVGIRTNKDQVFISDLAVDTKYRGQGIGEKLRGRLLTEVRGMDVVTFLDPTNVPAINLNKKFGARLLGRVSDPYDLGNKRSLETGTRLLMLTKNK